MPLLLALISLALGLIALALPLKVIASRNGVPDKNSFMIPAISFSACAASLFVHILHAIHWIGRGDLSALLDWGNVGIPLFLLLMTTVLNIVAVLKIRKTSIFL